MRKLLLLIAILTAGMALAQSLQVPRQARVGEPLEIVVEGVEQGAYPVEIAGPDGVRVVTIVAQDGRGEIDWTPDASGSYQLKLYLAPEKTLTAEVEVLPPAPAVSLEEEGLRVGGRLWPLPKAAWLEPLVTDEAVYLAAAGQPLVLVYPRTEEGQVHAYYPPAGVASLAEGPAVVYEDGKRELLTGLDRHVPYRDSWQKLDFLKTLNTFWVQSGLGERLPADPTGYRPYWSYFAFDPASLSEEDLNSWGRDLLARGHRPELAWGEGARYWTDAWQAAAGKDAVAGYPLTAALLQYAPLHPGSLAFFAAQARALDAAGKEVEALRLRNALTELQNFRPLLRAKEAARVFWALVIAYLALLLVLFVRYLPAQRRGLADLGGLLGSWSRNPLRRLRHLLLAYAGWGERLLAFLIFAAALISLYVWAGALQFEKATAAPELARATLVGADLSEWPAGPGLDALKAYQLADTDEQTARELLQEANAPLAFARMLEYRLSGDEAKLLEAYRLEASYPPVREALGLGGDSWSDVYRQAGVDRRGVPRLRDLCRVYLWGTLSGDPLRPLLGLGLANVAWVYAALALLAIWGLLHVWVLLLPRPRGATRWRGVVARLVELLVPGSTSFGKGWGVVLLFAGAYGAVLLYLGQVLSGGVLLAAAYLVHVFLWFEEAK